MNKEINLTKKLSDAKEIFQLTRKCFAHYQALIGVDCHLSALGENIDDVKSDILNHNVYICVVDHKIVGSARVIVDGDESKLTRFGVDPDFQSQGIGGLILNRIIDDLRGNNAETLSLYTASKFNSSNYNASVDFYIKYGFGIKDKNDDKGYERVKMILKF